MSSGVALVRTVLRTLRFVLRNRRAEIKRFAPQEAPIAILDATNVQYMAPLCGDHKYGVIHVHGECLHLTVSLVISAIRWTLKTGAPDVGYAIALLEKIRPVITITLIDNARLFYEVSKHYKGCRFLAVQNAARHDTAHLPPDLAQAIHIPEFACFGDFERDLYTRKGASVGCFYPIGSLRDAYYREQFAQKNNGVEFDICVVGEASPGWDQHEGQGFEDAVGNIAKYAVMFSKKYNKRLCIAGKRDPGKARNIEQIWYEKYIGKDQQVTPRVRESCSTYSLIDRSAVSVAFISTALQEGMSRGKRVLFCNFTGYSKWDFAVDGIWQLRDPGYEAFEERMLMLLQMSDQEFQAISSSTVKYTTNYDESMPTHRFLQHLIAEAVCGEAPDISRAQANEQYLQRVRTS